MHFIRVLGLISCNNVQRKKRKQATWFLKTDPNPHNYVHLRQIEFQNQSNGLWVKYNGNTWYAPGRSFANGVACKIHPISESQHVGERSEGLHKNAPLRLTNVVNHHARYNALQPSSSMILFAQSTRPTYGALSVLRLYLLVINGGRKPKRQSPHTQ